MRRWIIGGTVLVVLIGVGVFTQLRGTTRFDERAYPGSSLSKTPDEVFTDFDIDLPECADGRMRYWTGKLQLYVKLTGSPGCLSQFIEENRLTSYAPVPIPPATITRDRRAAEFGWELPTGRSYTTHKRTEGFYETSAYTDDAPEQTLYLHAWHQ